MTDEEAVAKVLSDYYAAFSTLNIAAILPYFLEPALLVGPLGVIPPLLPRSFQSSARQWRTFGAGNTAKVN